jgi:hypothetical protein
MDRDKAMALFHARNAVLRALRELEIAHLEVDSLWYSAAFFFRIKADLSMLARRLLCAAQSERRGRKHEEFVAPGNPSMGPVAEPQAKSS